MGKIYGRLGSLAQIDKKYDVAISTACGAKLDKIVVENIKVAEACKEHLKKTNGGIATFINIEQRD